MKQSAYKNAGVDIEAGAELVERIKPAVKRTNRAGSMGGLGGFGALFDPKAAGYKDPILVSSTDGVGTKIKIAIETGRHDTIGIDLVAMCVNDLIVQGAEPLFFLDYFACGHLNIGVAEQVINGIAKGCEQAGCALIGGETAEMPGMYADGDYDLAGFTVGAVERTHVLTGEKISAGDVVLGLASSGIHSNGYSLVRKLVGEGAESGSYEKPAPFAPHQSLGEALLIPTKIYVKSTLGAISEGGVHGIAHITGGGLLENIPRILPKGLSVKIDATKWEKHNVFRWIAEQGRISPDDMARTLNCGIGLVMIACASKAHSLVQTLEKHGERVYTIGEVIPSQENAERVVIENKAALLYGS